MRTKEKMNQLRSTLLGFDFGVLSLFYKYFYQFKPNSLEATIEEKLEGLPTFTFLQIGGNDGFINDPIFRLVKRHNCKGIIVEPQAEVFENRLKKTYRFERKVILENVAIAKETGTKRLYKIAFSNARWATGLASFDKKTIETQIERGYVREKAVKEGIKLPKNLEDYITAEEVSCKTISDLLKEYDFQHLDLLQIDTEGYDFEIIKTIDFIALKPKIISFEAEHLTEMDLKACKILFQKNGYQLTFVKRDAIAFLEH